MQQIKPIMIKHGPEPQNMADSIVEGTQDRIFYELFILVNAAVIEMADGLAGDIANGPWGDNDETT